MDQSDKDLGCSRNLLHQSFGAAGKKGFIVLSKILVTSNSDFNPVIQSFGNEFHELMWLWDAKIPIRYPDQLATLFHIHVALVQI